MVALAKSRHKHLLADPDIQRWFNNLERGSVVTAEERLRRLGRFCALVNHAPKSLIQLKRADPEGFEDFIADFVDASFKRGEKPTQVRNNLITIKSWLGHFGLRLERKIRLPAADYVDEVVPSKEQLAAILRQSDARGRVIVSLLAFSGVRPESIGNYLGSEGLRLKDLPELRVQEGEVMYTTVPTVVVVRKTISKARHQYFTFLPSEGCSYLREYFELRIRQGEQLGPDSAVVGHLRPGRLSFLRTTKLAWEVKLAIKKAGFTWRPYVLRSYCDTAFDIAENRGFLSHPWRQFFMGHKGDIEARYSTNKGRLPPEMIEEMREAYKRCEALLSTTIQPLEQSAVVKEAKIEALKSIAKSLLDMDLVEVKVAKEREEGRELTADEQIALFEDAIRKMRENQEEEDPQMIVSEGEFEAYLKEGWQFVSVLPSQRILIRK